MASRVRRIPIKTTAGGNDERETETERERERPREWRSAVDSGATLGVVT